MDSGHFLGNPFPNPDATEEFRVLGNNFSAQYGFAPAAVVSVVTKSGTNRWHGDGFEFLRNYDLDAANFFSHEPDTIKRNQFGGDIEDRSSMISCLFSGTSRGRKSRRRRPQAPPMCPPRRS